ncbi:unnamed protein product [Chilo suppressalis]|uniref:Ninjurin-1 n=1 Tax=Chilo suppressalis TaxID=168631 RepID=A0ABN8EAH8_CHISP|nr:unnamed protein product [Chilo suppressalis]
MAKETVLDMTLPKEAPKPGVEKPTGALDTTKPSKETSNAVSPAVPAREKISTADRDLNGFGSNLKEQLLPIDMDSNADSHADGERIEMLPHNEDKKGEDHENDGEDDIGFRMGNGSVHGATPMAAGDHDDGKWPGLDADETDNPYDKAHDDARTVIEESPNVNTYQQKKNLAQGMMDLALLSANANQLRYVLETSAGGHPYYYPSVVLISLSIILQVAVGVGLILNSRYDVNHYVDICKADKINNMTVLGVFLVTIVNVFITSFSVAPSNTAVIQAG